MKKIFKIKLLIILVCIILIGLIFMGFYFFKLDFLLYVFIFIVVFSSVIYVALKISDIFTENPCPVTLFVFGISIFFTIIIVKRRNENETLKTGNYSSSQRSANHTYIKNNDNKINEKRHFQSSTNQDIIENYEKKELVIEKYEIDSTLLSLLPARLTDRSEQIIVRNSYVVSYNKDFKLPNWVAWLIKVDQMDVNQPFTFSYLEDGYTTIPRANPDDYFESGWSIGQMFPPEDTKWFLGQVSSYMMTNTCPMDPDLYNGLWKSMEEECRKWAKKWGDVFVICGPLPLRQPYNTIGDNKVAVPWAFFKIVLCLNNPPKAYGFVVKNCSGENKNDLYYNSVREIERLTNIDFFTLLDDPFENMIETYVNMNEW